MATLNSTTKLSQLVQTSPHPCPLVNLFSSLPPHINSISHIFIHYSFPTILPLCLFELLRKRTITLKPECWCGCRVGENISSFACCSVQLAFELVISMHLEILSVGETGRDWQESTGSLLDELVIVFSVKCHTCLFWSASIMTQSKGDISIRPRRHVHAWTLAKTW